MLLVDLIHNFQEDSPINLRQLAVSQRQHRGGSRRIIYDAQIPERVTIGERAFLLAVDFDLTDPFKDDIVGSTLVALSKDVVVSDRHAGLHLLYEAADL